MERRYLSTIGKKSTYWYLVVKDRGRLRLGKWKIEVWGGEHIEVQGRGKHDWRGECMEDQGNGK